MDLTPYGFLVTFKLSGTAMYWYRQLDVFASSFTSSVWESFLGLGKALAVRCLRGRLRAAEVLLGD